MESLIILAIWIIGAFIAYFWKIKDWDKTMFEKIWLSIFWPCVLIFYPIHYFHNRNKDK